MPIYEKFIGRHRDSFSSLADMQENFKITWPEDFNFAYDVMDVLGTEKPDKLALVYVSDDEQEKRFTFSDVMRYSNKAANYLTSLGVKKGDRVLLVLKRSYWFWFIMLALHKIGAVAVQATHQLMVKDYVYRCNRAGMSVAIITGDNDCTERFDEGEGQYETIRLKLVTKHKNVPGWLDIEKGIEEASDVWVRPTGEAATKATDMMFIAFSSGTTGYPKMILHDHTYPLGHIGTGIFWHRVVDGGLHFTVSDTGWMKSMWGKFYGQWMGETAHFVYDFEKFSGENILRMLDKYKITTFCVPPTMYRMMLQCDVKKYDLSSIVHCCTAGEALNADIYNTWKEATGLSIYEGFGQSETSVCIATLYPFDEPVPGAIGKPVPGYDICLLDEDGEPCAAGVTGEICIRGYFDGDRPRGLFYNYNESLEDTQKAWHDGFYHTGDTAYTDERGLIHYVGRNDDVIKSSGYRIGPFEIESVLLEHPAVLETAVTGVPDPVRGHIVKATVVLRPEWTPSDALVKELQDYVKKNTAPYKYPRIIEFVDSLPRTFSGKVRRVEIRQRDQERLEKKD
ncbi:MAG: AMP-binding protein [Clostridia bacterium]|nr:AMP-binding protein [Clostridia bacterium]